MAGQIRALFTFEECEAEYARYKIEHKVHEFKGRPPQNRNPFAQKMSMLLHFASLVKRSYWDTGDYMTYRIILHEVPCRKRVVYNDKIS